MKFEASRQEIAEIAKRHRYSATNVEKVIRLCLILDDLNTLSPFKGNLSLKGGTAINLLSYDNLPRLSVDLDFNFAYNTTKEQMIEIRKTINDALDSYCTDAGYYRTNRNTFTLDSLSLVYNTTTGSKDKIKLDINYQNRCHILDQRHTQINFPFFIENKKLTIKHLNTIELFAGKIKAFFERSKPRDIFDIYMLAKSGKFSLPEEKQLLRKCTIFYGAIGNEKKNPIFTDNVSFINDIPFKDIKTQLLPMLHINYGKYDVNEINTTVINYIQNLMVPDQNDLDFWDSFIEGKYNPHLLFSKEIADNLMNHPVALRTQKIYINSNLKQYISESSVFPPEQDAYRHFIRCKIAGRDLLGKEISSKDFNSYSLGNIKAEDLALVYFNNEIRTYAGIEQDSSFQRNTGPKR